MAWNDGKDPAETLLALLFTQGEGNVEDVDVSGATATFSTPDEFTTSVLTLAHATPAITVPAPKAIGQLKRLYLVQDESGSRVPTWTGATINWLSGSAPTLSTAGGAVDYIALLSLDGTTWEAIPALGPSAAPTLTYDTAGSTVAAATATAVGTTGSTTTTPYGYTTSAQADAIPVAINALIADVLVMRKFQVYLATALIRAGILA